jgi:TRAP transporter TAXI family solute receptor
MAHEARRIALAVAGAVLVAAALGCSRGPDAAALRTEVKAKLDQRFKPGLFDLVGLRRQGSAPLPTTETGTKRLAVYYNASLKLNEGYDFGSWEGLSPGTLAQVLGATEKGIYGVRAGETRSGDVINVFGSSTYEWTGDRWQNVDATSAGGVARPGAPGISSPPSKSRQLIERLAALVDIPPPGVPSYDEQIISEELEHAFREINARRDRRKHVYLFASGPPDGEYYPVFESLVTRVAVLGHKITARNVTTQGSVENARLIDRKEADYALMQSNLAALAATGEGPFAHGGMVTSLRALGSLFPEPVHVVVSARSAVRTLGDLRGKRVAIGAPDSGTRADALAVLALHGLSVKDLTEVRDEGLEAAGAQLQAGRLDAFFATVGAPTRKLQRLATRHPIRLLSLDATAVERLVTQHSGLVRLVIPAHSYPGQAEDVTTVAATALLVTRDDVPEAEAALVLRLVFENPDYLSAGSAQGTKISKRTGLRGITIPMHPAAGPYFSGPCDSCARPPAGPGARSR